VRAWVRVLASAMAAILRSTMVLRGLPIVVNDDGLQRTPIGQMAYHRLTVFVTGVSGVHEAWRDARQVKRSIAQGQGTKTSLPEMDGSRVPRL
jgi:hypothetical protein